MERGAFDKVIACMELAYSVLEGGVSCKTIEEAKERIMQASSLLDEAFEEIGSNPKIEI